MKERAPKIKYMSSTSDLELENATLIRSIYAKNRPNIIEKCMCDGLTYSSAAEEKFSST